MKFRKALSLIALLIGLPVVVISQPVPGVATPQATPAKAPGNTTKSDIVEEEEGFIGVTGDDTADKEEEDGSFWMSFSPVGPDTRINWQQGASPRGDFNNYRDNSIVQSPSV